MQLFLLVSNMLFMLLKQSSGIRGSFVSMVLEVVSVSLMEMFASGRSVRVIFLVEVHRYEAL